MLLTPVVYLLGIIGTRITRAMEFAADRFSVERGYGAYLRSGLIAVHVNNAANLNPDWLYAFLHFDHPALVERLAAIEQHMRAVVKKKTGSEPPEDSAEAIALYGKEFQESLAKLHPEAMASITAAPSASLNVREHEHSHDDDKSLNIAPLTLLKTIGATGGENEGGAAEKLDSDRAEHRRTAAP